MWFKHPHLTPASLRAAKAAPPPPAVPFPRKRVGPRPIGILGLHLPMLPVKMFPYFVILQVCAAIEACHAYMVEQGIELAIRYGPTSSVYDIDAPWDTYSGFWLGVQSDTRLRWALGWEVERMQRIYETTAETITPYERQVTTLMTAQRLTQMYREVRRRHPREEPYGRRAGGGRQSRHSAGLAERGTGRHAAARREAG